MWWMTLAGLAPRPFLRCQAVDSSCFFGASNIGEHRGCKFQNMEMHLRNSWHSLIAGNSRARIQWNNQIWYQPAHHPIDISVWVVSQNLHPFFHVFLLLMGGNKDIDVKLKWAPAGPPFLSHYLRMIFKGPQKVTFRLTSHMQEGVYKWLDNLANYGVLKRF